MASASGGGGWNLTLFGTGLDSSLTRRQEVYGWGFAFSISERQASSINLHPNPGSTTFTLQLPDALHRSQLLVQDLTGRTVVNAPLVSPTVDASDWPGGSYLVEVIAPDGRRFRGRWVKL